MHTPVLLNKVLEYLPLETGTHFIDGTAGDGGYILRILESNPQARVMGIDLDQANLEKLGKEFAQTGLSQRVTLVQGNFKNIKHFAGQHGFVPASAVILDLGFSSSQLDDPIRGLAFQVAGPLDMRFSQQSSLQAAEIVNTYSQAELVRVLAEYGEEKFAVKITKEIIRYREKSKITDTRQLFMIIQSALPKPLTHKAADHARRVFQALRIEVNDELNNLKFVLPEILNLLEPGGRILVISFHSLEDRIVKEFFVSKAHVCVCPPDFPYCVCGKNPELKILTKKPVMATLEEIKNNSRSKPAKLRVAQKIPVTNNKTQN